MTIVCFSRLGGIHELLALVPSPSRHRICTIMAADNHHRHIEWRLGAIRKMYLALLYISLAIYTLSYGSIDQVYSRNSSLNDLGTQDCHNVLIPSDSMRRGSYYYSHEWRESSWTSPPKVRSPDKMSRAGVASTKSVFRGNDSFTGQIVSCK
jgi:hypothetical protein